jgi:hypothetical protein
MILWLLLILGFVMGFMLFISSMIVFWAWLSAKFTRDLKKDGFYD